VTFHSRNPQQKEKNMNLVKTSLLAAAAALLQLGLLSAQSGDIVATGTFHGAAHQTSGRATVYSVNGKQTLRLTNFKTSNGPNVHVVLIAASDAQDNDNFLSKNVDRVDLGKLKGNEGDQNYTVPAGTDFSKYRAVSIYCERFNANFGAAPLEK
jgi:hypothetical protein